MLRRVPAAVLVALTMVLTALVPAADAAPMPTRSEWLHDTVVALHGARPWVADRAARGGGKLALNLDIDNTSLQTYYAPGKAIPATLRLARYAKSKGVHILFNTGRNVRLRERTIAQLKRAGFPVDGLCAHYKGESLADSKQRCRRSFVNNGFRLIANIGNRRTDFVGGNYERAYRLPNYDNRLG
jgi:HAD superfamily, subfamily IIIB (Acid phosphatase)